MMIRYFERVQRSLRRSLLLPALFTNVIGVALAYRYAYLTLADALGDSLPLFFSLCGTLSLVAVSGGVMVCFLRLRALRRVEASRGAPSTALLTEAVHEVHRLPDFIFAAALVLWLFTASLTGLLMAWLDESVTVGLALRMSWPGLLFGPLTALLCYCVTTLRMRQAVLVLADLGLTHAQVIAAAPRRAQIRLRLVVFTAIATVTPATLIWDVCTVLAERAFAQVLAESTPEAQALKAEALRVEALVSGGVLCVLVFGLALLAAYLGGTLLGRPIRDLGEEAHRIAEGNLSRPRLIPAEDEVGAVSAAFSTMRAHLADVLSQLRGAGVRIGSTTEEILATSTRYEAGAAEQASSLDQTSATTEELARSARQIAENAGSVADMAHKTLAAARGGQASAESFLETMNRMRHDNQAIAAAVARLNKRVQQIGKIVEFINGVADKSDLLALNAELEGTKAGEVGQGFSLVAAEMRRLAENVIESTKEIEGLIEEVRDASGAAVMATEGGVRATETGTALAQQVSESLRQIVELAGRTSDAVRAISLATQQQQSGTDLLAEAMADILRITQQSHNATKQVIGANGDLSTLSRDLRAVVERFQIESRPPEAGG